MAATAVTVAVTAVTVAVTAVTAAGTGVTVVGMVVTVAGMEATEMADTEVTDTGDMAAGMAGMGDTEEATRDFEGSNVLNCRVAKLSE